MHESTLEPSPPVFDQEPKKRWWSYLNRYHWYVFALASMGWLFDTMDQNIFVISRSKTLAEFNRPEMFGDVTSIFIVGWATGGLIFGMIGDRWGRARTMALTIFIYAGFTGLSGLTQNYFQFAVSRFLTGVGVGGEFAAGAALVAETMPEQARAGALSMLQALSAVGNMTGAGLFYFVGSYWGGGWRGLYYVGALPALLAVVVRLGMKEPEKWVAAKKHAAETGQSLNLGKFTDLIRMPRWRKSAIIGLLLAVPGITGVWALGFYSPELIDSAHPAMAPEVRAEIESVIANGGTKEAVEKQSPAARKVYDALRQRTIQPGEIVEEMPLSEGRKVRMTALVNKTLLPKDHDWLKTQAFFLQQMGAFLGMICFGMVTSRLGRRPAFFLSFSFAWLTVLLAFGTFYDRSQVWYIFPLLGFGTLAPFSGYTIYLPELFPTRLRTTGIGLCYNVGRYFAAIGPLVLGALTRLFIGKFELPAFRVAAMSVSAIYLVAIITLIWAPETRNQPLPED